MIGRRLPIRRNQLATPRAGGASGRKVRRASVRLTPARAGALLAMLLAGAGLYGVTASAAFGLRSIDLPALQYTDSAAVRSNLPVVEGDNLFSLATGPLVARLLALPAVAGAHVEIALPDRLVVRIEERTPILVWQVDQRRYLVDRRGVLFAEVSPAVAATGILTGLPVVVDSRLSSVAALTETDSLEPIVLDAATRLASLRPADVGSAAERLSVEVSDEHGFVLRATPIGWLAIFGFYTPTLRTTDLIAGQVRLLRSLLADREATVERVVLADDTNGTYLPWPTAKSTPTPRPTPTPRATATPRPGATARP